MSDSYFTIAKTGEGKVTEKMSRFLSFAHHVTDVEEAKALIKEYQNKYHDSRHVCWAYMIGAAREQWQLNDNGEPSGTAGKPILGQINSAVVTDLVVIVVRYFGGIKLGTPGLIAAYREAARLAIEDAGRRECFKTQDISFVFPYMGMNDVMKLVKSNSYQVVSQQFDNTCSMTLRIKDSEVEGVKARLDKIDGVSVHG